MRRTSRATWSDAPAIRGMPVPLRPAAAIRGHGGNARSHGRGGRRSGCEISGPSHRAVLPENQPTNHADCRNGENPGRRRCRPSRIMLSTANLLRPDATAMSKKNAPTDRALLACSGRWRSGTWFASRNRFSRLSPPEREGTGGPLRFLRQRQDPGGQSGPVAHCAFMRNRPTMAVRPKTPGVSAQQTANE